MNQRLTKRYISIFVIILAVIGLISIFKPKSTAELTPSEQIIQTQLGADQARKALGKHILFPEGDEPTIRKVTATVPDPFFSKAEVGDYLFIFYKSRIAYIYSLKKDIIVNAGVVWVAPTNAQDKTKEGLKLDPNATATSTKK